MEIKIKGKKYMLAFTFNSFRYMADFDIGSFSEVESKPFLMVSILSDLFFGAMNNKRDTYFDHDTCDELLETYLDDNDIGELTQGLMKLLENSSFFKAHQQDVTNP